MSAKPRILGVAALLAALVTALVSGTGNTNAEAAQVADHGQLVGETPRLNLPEVIDGIVWATIQLQDRVIVGGDFLQVQDENGAIVDQPYLFAYDINTGEMIDVGEFDARYQFAALDPATGAALDWEPVTNSQEGVLEITPIDRGLLVGHDRDLVGGFSVGRQAFFDFGGTTPGYVPPVVTEIDCTAVVTAAGNVDLTWNEIPSVATYAVRRDGSWLASVDDESYTDTTAAVGQHTYVIRYRLAGDTINTTCSPDPITIAPQPVDELTCDATVVGDGVSVVWNSIGVDAYQVRRNGGWIGQTAGLSYVDPDGTEADSYQVRYRQNGTTTTVDCV